MALEDIIKKIQDNANEKIVQITKETEIEINKIILKAKENGEKEKQKILEQTENEMKRLSKNKIIEAKLEAQKNLLFQKQKILDNVFEKAYEEIVNLFDKEYLDIISNLILKYAEIGNEKIIISAKNKSRINENLLSQINQKLLINGKKGEIELSSETRNIEGIILSQEKKEINCSFNIIFNQAREFLEIKIATILFE
ncbi:MAG: V-type ATP synthase subunit E family protein [bacterium]